MILDLIVSKNMARRQLNPGQRALMALEYERFYAEATKVGRPIGNPAQSEVAESKETVADLRPSPEVRERKSSERAAKVVGASGRAVQQAKAVQRDAPDLAAKVRSGTLALDAADRERKRRVAAVPKPGPTAAAGAWRGRADTDTRPRRMATQVYPRSAAGPAGHGGEVVPVGGFTVARDGPGTGAPCGRVGPPPGRSHPVGRRTAWQQGGGFFSVSRRYARRRQAVSGACASLAVRTPPGRTRRPAPVPVS